MLLLTFLNCVQTAINYKNLGNSTYVWRSGLFFGPKKKKKPITTRLISPTTNLFLLVLTPSFTSQLFYSHLKITNITSYLKLAYFQAQFCSVTPSRTNIQFYGLREVLASCSSVTCDVGGSCVCARTRHDGPHARCVCACVCARALAVCFCVSAQLLIYLLHRLSRRLQLRRKCAAACWDPSPCNTHTHRASFKAPQVQFSSKEISFS